MRHFQPRLGWDSASVGMNCRKCPLPREQLPKMSDILQDILSYCPLFSYTSLDRSAFLTSLRVSRFPFGLFVFPTCATGGWTMRCTTNPGTFTPRSNVSLHYTIGLGFVKGKMRRNRNSELGILKMRERAKSEPPRTERSAPQISHDRRPGASDVAPSFSSACPHKGGATSRTFGVALD
jgi:hypothetical protein